jgi:hypothetical protein
MMCRAAVALGLVVLTLASCERQRYFPDRAGPPYPFHLHVADAVDIQVFREGTSIEVVNATPHGFRDFKLWINQRYAMRVDRLDPGQTRRFSLWDFYDERGEVMNAGGFFRTYEPDPVRLVQIQLDEESPLIGLVTIRREPLEERERL